MAERRCVFCGRLIDLDKYALFRLPPDHPRERDEVYLRYLEARGESAEKAFLPGVCGIGSPDTSKISWENGRLTLVTKTGRNTDTLICPSCHNEIFRNTDDASVNSAVFFGGNGSGKTSLVLALANECIVRQFSHDDSYRYFFNEKTYDPLEITGNAERMSEGIKPDDLREPIAIYRVTGAGAEDHIYCDVMHDMSDGDTADEESMEVSAPFVSDAGNFVYAVPADKLAEVLMSADGSADISVKLDIFRMMSAFRFREEAPVLNVVLTKLDLLEGDNGIGADILKIYDDERLLKNYIYTAFPSIEEFSPHFGGVRVYAVSAYSSMAGKYADQLLKMYAGIFG